MQKKRNLLKLMAGAALLVLGVTGCGTLTIPQYTAGASQQARTVESQGLTVTVDPVCDRERADTYFKVNPAGKGVVIIHLEAANQSTNAAWLLSEANMNLAVAGQTNDLNANVQNVQGDYGAATGLSAAAAPFMLIPGPDLFVGLPLMLSGGKVARDASVVQKNFVDKEWHNQTLSPGQQAQGFIYFNLKEPPGATHSATLRMDCLDVRSQQTNTLIFPLSYETK